MKVDDTRCTLASLPRGRWCWLHADLAEADKYADLIHIDDPNNKVLTLAMLGEKIADKVDDDVLTWVSRFEQSLRYSSVGSRKLLMKDPPRPTGNQLHDALIAGLAEYLS